MPAFPQPIDAFRIAIAKWEGTWSDDPDDTGNYAHGNDGTTRLVGSMYGVTPDVYADYLGVDPGTITAQDMKTKLTLPIAAEIAVNRFYVAPKFSRLTWSPMVAIAVDIGWGSGPRLATTILQRVIDTNVDGAIGPQTATALDQYIEAHGPAAACDALSAARADYYRSISQPGTKNAKYRQGWLNRANWFLSTNNPPSWFDAWRTWTSPSPANSSRPVA